MLGPILAWSFVAFLIGLITGFVIGIWLPPPAAEGETRCDLDPLANVNEIGTGNIK